MEKQFLFECVVPADQRAVMDDTPDAYRVTQEDSAVCVIYGSYRNRWMANVSSRWLVIHLLKALKKYGGHAVDCDHPVNCTCGWDEFKQQLRQKAED